MTNVNDSAIGNARHALFVLVCAAEFLLRTWATTTELLMTGRLFMFALLQLGKEKAVTIMKGVSLCFANARLRPY